MRRDVGTDARQPGQQQERRRIGEGIASTAKAGKELDHDLQEQQYGRDNNCPKEGRIVGLPARGEKLRDDEDVRLIVV